MVSPLTLISQEDVNDLEKPFSEEDIWNAINDLGKDKSPGPNGFNIAFFRGYWLFVKREIGGFFADLHEKGVFEKSLNATFILLDTKSGWH